jgi:uncharacterized protein with FMN-binding domain
VRPRIVIGGVLVSVGILAAGVESAVLQTHTTTSASGGTSSGGTSSGSTGTSGGSSIGGSSGSTSTSTYKDGTYTGTAEQTQYGDVQVKVTISGGKITDVTALQLTDREQRSVQISAEAAPILRQEAISAQSASIDTVSGATYTSEGYIGSLQSALDQAK